MRGPGSGPVPPPRPLVMQSEPSPFICMQSFHFVHSFTWYPVLCAVLCSLSFLRIVCVFRQRETHWRSLFPYTLFLFLPLQIHPRVILPSRRWVRFWTFSYTQLPSRVKHEQLWQTDQNPLRCASAYITLAKSHDFTLANRCFCSQRCRVHPAYPRSAFGGCVYMQRVSQSEYFLGSVETIYICLHVTCRPTQS